MKEKVDKRVMWAFPWNYKEGLAISLGLFLAGLMLEVATAGSSFNAAVYPLNVMLGLGLLGFYTFVYIFFKNSRIVKWLCGVPAAICSISLVTFNVLIMGLIAQNDPNASGIIKVFGLSEMTTSWMFILAVIFFQTTLGFVTLKRAFDGILKNGGFVLNHLGLWIVIWAAILGSGDLQRLTMDLYEGQTVWEAKDEHGHKIPMDVAFKLEEFNMEEYNPKLVVIESEDAKIVEDISNNMQMLEEGKSLKMGEFEVYVEQFLPMAGRVEERYERVNEIGSAPAAFVKTTFGGEAIDGWVTCGSFMKQGQFLKLDNKYSLAMSVPEPKKYTSICQLYTKSGQNEQITIEVNKPVSAGDWKVYQLSYDDRYGKWSQLSVIELVLDPWLPVVYTGVFMMLLGGVYIFWVGSRIGSEKK
ncbi:hypothetical protein R9C00_17825 [Flammeovirgaceae bacterium SG7u.111]|nr:hypothetical protein [Flammeovirgaceae bacterium SG7u.132]WPO33563.1 hypothetical protein R9C00_17825 [Flammeovirgaceae bacterium SG7u.111]